MQHSLRKNSQRAVFYFCQFGVLFIQSPPSRRCNVQGGRQMSSKQFYPSGVFLNAPEFRNLKFTPPTIEEWFKEWKTAVEAGSCRDLLSLLHWGLQLVPSSENQESKISLLCHYLSVADGHNSPKNFTGSDYKQATIFGSMSEQEVLRMLADKAWMELCNRVFVFSSDDGFGNKMKYESYFLTPKLAESFIRFINPERWFDGTYWNCDQANLDRNGKSAYDAKATAFTKYFLRCAWDSRSVLERRHGVEYRDLSEEERASLDNQIKFFHALKPTIAKLMVRYDMTKYLHDSPLNHPTRRVLREIAQHGLSWRSKIDPQMVDLAKAYGELGPDGHLANSHREVIRVLLLYPLVAAGRKSYIREKNQRNAAERAETLAHAQQVVEDAIAALRKVE